MTPARAKELRHRPAIQRHGMTISFPPAIQPHMDCGGMVAEQLRAVGVNVTIQPHGWGVAA